jgi:hypothetical protein
MEPDWTRRIPSKTICDFFYAFYVVYVIILAISVVTTLIAFFHMKKFGFVGILMGVQGLVVSGIAATMMLFNYLVCDRALLGKGMDSI